MSLKVFKTILKKSFGLHFFTKFPKNFFQFILI